MIPRSEIETVLSLAKIEEVIGEDRKLKKCGSHYKCLCPFHQEKSPSFIVYPSTNTFKCFGCGQQGNVIDYVMQANAFTFVEAIRFLAKKYKIALSEEPDKEYSTQQKEEYRHRETLIMCYQQVQAFFVRNLSEQTEEAQKAHDYAVKRWGEDFVNKYGIGYAYNDFNKLKEFAKTAHIPESTLIELGLLAVSQKNGSVYDFYRGRIMIPIRSISQLIIGYTARLVESNVKPDDSGSLPPKYVNSKESVLYDKDKSVFGIDAARHLGATKDLFYMVEGGPDVLRLQSIGILNTVASLGSDWTDNQLKLVQRYAHNLCFIPDIDPPKKGEVFGTGIKKVMKSGEKALAMGFDHIFVKEIIVSTSHDGKDKKPKGKKELKPAKVDADSYFTSEKIFGEVKEQSFIVWYAAKLHADNKDDAIRNVGIIARLLAYIKDEYKVNIIIGEIKPYINVTMKVWHDAIKNACSIMAKDNILKDSKDKNLDSEALEKYGFQELDNCYVSMNAENKRYAWSNFVLHPLFHIKDVLSSSRLFTIINEDGMEQIIELSQEDLANRTRFIVKVESLGNYTWFGREDNLMSIKRYLYKATDTAYLIRQMGWQRRGGFYAFGNGVFYENNWYGTDKYGIIRLNEHTKEQRNYYLPSSSEIYEDDPSIYQFERRFIYNATNSFTMFDYVQQMIDCFGNNAKVGFSFLVATLFRDVVVHYMKAFPILNVFGVKGTGKSELGHSLMSFFITNNTPTNIQNSTMAALSEVVAQCSNALVHIDEFKNNIDVNKIEFLKGLWDGSGRSRMNMDRDKRREITQVDAGVILTGQEMPTRDIALFSRLIFLRTSSSGEHRTQEERRRFQKLVDLRKAGCSHITLEILRYRAQFESNFLSSMQTAYDDLRAGVEREDVSERLLNNWVVPLAAIHSLRNFLVLPFTYDELLKICCGQIKEQNSLSVEGSEIASFWNVVDFIYREGHIYESSDFKILAVRKLHLQENKKSYFIEFDQIKEVLCIRHKRVLELYKKHAKDVGEEAISNSSMNYYLKGDAAFLGESVTMRFLDMRDGKVQQEKKVVKRKDGTEVVKFFDKIQTGQAYCFDYKMVQQLYAIQLKSVPVSETDNGEFDFDAANPQDPSNEGREDVRNEE